MNQTNNILDANICNNCGGVWFSPQFEVEGEPDVCPFCAKGVSRTPTKLNTDYGGQSQPSDEIIALMDQKTSRPLVPKVCGFCTNFVFVAPEDVVKATTCPYCSDKLQKIDENQGNTTNDVREDDSTGDITWSHIRITFKNERKGGFKLFSKPKDPVTGICLGTCAQTQRIRIMNVDTQESTWHSVSSIDTITEIPIIPDQK